MEEQQKGALVINHMGGVGDIKQIVCEIDFKPFELNFGEILYLKDEKLMKQEFEKKLEVILKEENNIELVVISGGTTYDYENALKNETLTEPYRSEKEFLDECKYPTIGICLGHQILGHCSGAAIRPLNPHQYFTKETKMEYFGKECDVSYFHRNYIDQEELLEACKSVKILQLGKRTHIEKENGVFDIVLSFIDMEKKRLGCQGHFESGVSIDKERMDFAVHIFKSFLDLFKEKE